MPKIDLGNWKSDDYFPFSLFRLLGIMYFPDDPQKRNQAIVTSLTNTKISMLEEATPEQRELIVKNLNLPPGGENPYSELEKTLKDAGADKTLLNSPSYEDFRKESGKAVLKGSIAGDILTLIKRMVSAKPKGGPSVKKAVFIIENFLAESLKKEGHPANRRFYMECWSEYRGVSHLWAAYGFWMNYLSKRGFLHSASDLYAFLNIAEDFREFGITFKPHGRKDSILLKDETWQPPVDLPRISCDLPLPPLPDEQIKALQEDYQAPV
ncbi:MAG: hypothetical protein HN472_16140 [Nitrospina sp.]|nr:hypothetical protein [Nitrospina sp.]